MKDVYSILRRRINLATIKDELMSLETVITRHYDNHTLTPRELARLDVRIMERLAEL